MVPGEVAHRGRVANVPSAKLLGKRGLHGAPVLAVWFAVSVEGELRGILVTLRPRVVHRHLGATVGGTADPATLIEPEALVACAEGAIIVEAFGVGIANRGVLVVEVVARRREGETAMRVDCGQHNPEG